MRSHLYKVSFEGKWQGRFEDLEEALDWGRDVAETGRLVHVADRGIFSTRLLAVYPESREEGKRLWRVRSAGASL